MPRSRPSPGPEDPWEEPGKRSFDRQPSILNWGQLWAIVAAAPSGDNERRRCTSKGILQQCEPAKCKQSAIRLEITSSHDSLLEQMGFEPSVPRRAATAALAAYPVAAVHFGVVYSA